jgi:uncharacterized membrane protein YgcG
VYFFLFPKKALNYATEIFFLILFLNWICQIKRSILYLLYTFLGCVLYIMYFICYFFFKSEERQSAKGAGGNGGGGSGGAGSSGSGSGKSSAPIDYSRYVKRFGSAAECGSPYCKDLNYRFVY